MARGFHLTIDEWFYNSFANPNKYIEATQFFYKIYEVCDKMVIKKNTPLAHKFYQLDLESGRWPPEQRRAVKFIKNLFLSNSNKVHWVDEVEEFKEDIVNHLSRHDIYLVQMCLKTNKKILITTDATLHSNVNDLHETLSITSFMAEDFVKKYLENLGFLE